MTQIQPALTPEEWEDNPRAVECQWQTGGYRYTVAAEVLEDGTRGVSLCYPHADSIAGTWIPPEKVPAVAALCLHGQPFGFTRFDSDRHRECAAGYDHALNALRDYVAGSGREAQAFASQEDEMRRNRQWHESMADRIEALLPPR